MESATHGERGYAVLEAVGRQREIGLVLQRVDVVHLGMDLGLAVQVGIHIRPAAQQYAVEARQSRWPIHAVGSRSSNQRDGIRPGEPDRLQQRPRGDDSGVARGGCVLGEAPDECDAGAGHGVRLFIRRRGVYVPQRLVQNRIDVRTKTVVVHDRGALPGELQLVARGPRLWRLARFHDPIMAPSWLWTTLHGAWPLAC